MKRKQTVLAMAVMTALLTPISGGVHASNLPEENFTVSGNVATGNYDGQGTFTRPDSTSGANGQG